jgi:hypothetical protein
LHRFGDAKGFGLRLQTDFAGVCAARGLGTVFAYIWVGADDSQEHPTPKDHQLGGKAYAIH